MADTTKVDKQTDEADLPAVLRERFNLSVEPRLYAAKRNRAKPVLLYDAGGVAVAARWERGHIFCWLPSITPAEFAEFNRFPVAA